MIKIDQEQLEARQAHLNEVKQKLKNDFIGIDRIIDDLLDYIQVWYFMPDLLERPIIINLWGMTGVGKTDLIRKMVKYLDFQDRFAEVELSNIDSTSWRSSVSDILERNEINDGKPAIVLFDEIQRFNTVDNEGKPLPQTKYTDFWELLSDGRLSKKEKTDLDYYLGNMIFNNKEIQRKKLKGEEVDDNPTVGFWEAQQMKKMLGLGADLGEIADITQRDMIEMITTEKKKKKIYEPINHSQTLIIISGNLDEAFDMSKQTSEADIDADIFHAYTQKITMVDIKNALSKKFRPEQVARFGNIHLIYTSLTKANFEKLIAREIEKIVEKTYKKTKIKLTTDTSLNELIYRNGVFPVQGVRPVFSSVIDILESNLSKYLFSALKQKAKNIDIKYDKSKSVIMTIIGKETSSFPFVGRIDKIRESNLKDTVANISVHEAGHAVVYMALFGLVPLQLKSKVASSYAGGFTFPHQIHETRENILKKIKIFLAGGLAEEVMFGKPNASVGRSNDREQVTSLAVDFVRRYGFDDEFAANYVLEFAYAMNKDITDADIEKMIAKLSAETQEILSEHKPLLHHLSIELALKGSLDAPEINVIAQKFGLNAFVKEEGFLEIYNYDKHLVSQ
jgi:Peptidase family M41/ATPase family associated with various cellular activities (AAA)